MHIRTMEMRHLYNMKLTTDPSVAPDMQIIWEKLFQNILEYSLYKHTGLHGETCEIQPANSSKN